MLKTMPLDYVPERTCDHPGCTAIADTIHFKSDGWDYPHPELAPVHCYFAIGMKKWGGDARSALCARRCGVEIPKTEARAL